MLDRLYIVTLSILATHQIDAAYWKEWEMFRIPGGIQIFDCLNFGALLLLLVGFQHLTRRLISGYLFSLSLGILGVLTLVIHGGFFLAGMGRFGLPVSYLVILLCGITGAFQLVFTIRSRPEFPARPNPSAG